MTTPTLLPARPWAIPAGRQILPVDVDRDVWLETRKRFLCGSDIGALFGVSNYGDEYTVWADKTGQTPSNQTSDAQAYGLDKEDWLIKHWIARYAEEPYWIRNVGMIQSRVYKRAAVDVDRLAVTIEDGIVRRGIAEGKTWQGDRDAWGTDEAPCIPTPFVFQGSWQIGCTGREFVDFIVDLGRHRIIRRRLPRDQDLIKFMFRAGAKFWGHHVIGGRPPDATRRADEVIKYVFGAGPPGKGDSHELTDAQCELMRAVNQFDRTIERFKIERANMLAELQAQIGSATEILWPGGDLAATWRPTKTIDGADKGWRIAHPDIVEAYGVTKTSVEIDLDKYVADHDGELPEGTRYRRMFLPKTAKENKT
jgi:predicted phage-related endonuclease